MSSLPAAAPKLSPRAGARLWVLIPCAGTGLRAGGGTVAKQYRLLDGMPMVMHTVAAFAAVGGVAGGVLVVAQGDSFFHDVALPRGWSADGCGGDTRAASVAAGLFALGQRGACAGDWVLVHDAARCLVTPPLIQALVDRCRDDEVGGLLAVPLADTLKRGVSGRAIGTEDREGKWLAQTPQMFRLGLLRTALASAAAAGGTATDEASAVERMGMQPLLVRGSLSNLKVTWPEDFALAEALLTLRRAAGKGSTGDT